MILFFILLVGLVLLAVLTLRQYGCRFPKIHDPYARGDVYGTNKTNMMASPVKKVSVVDYGSRVRYINEVYTQSGAGTIGDVIHLPTPPVGAKVLAHLSVVCFSVGGAGATLALGKTGAATSLKAATSIAAAGNFALTTPANGADDVTIGTDEELIATNGTAAIVDGQVIRFRIAYVENS